MKKNLSYMDSVHRAGTIWNLTVMVLLFMFPVSVALIFGVKPDWNALLMGLIATAPMYWVVGVIETVTYVPMLGAGGSYLSFVTGNISNLTHPFRLGGDVISAERLLQRPALGVVEVGVGGPGGGQPVPQAF